MKIQPLFRAISAIMILYSAVCISAAATSAEYEGPGMRLYNGSVSAMSWTMGEDAAPVTTNGSMDYAGTTGITYDRLGNPLRVSFSSPRGSYAKYVYSAAGERLKAEHYTGMAVQVNPVEPTLMTDSGRTVDKADNPDNAETAYNPTPAAIDPTIAGMTRLEYHGPVIYRNGKVDMVRFPGGYPTIDGSDVTFHYYTQDYLGDLNFGLNFLLSTFFSNFAL